jgi:hypothetical protein
VNVDDLEQAVAAWMTRCYRDGCERAPARQQSPRFRGKYCAPCLERLHAETPEQPAP